MSIWDWLLGRQSNEHVMGESEPVTTAAEQGYDEYDMRRTLPHNGRHLPEADRQVQGWNPDAPARGNATGPVGGGRGSSQSFNGMKPTNDTMRRH